MRRTISGKYRLSDRIGRGGTGEVWAAENMTTSAAVAVKVLDTSDERDARAARFRQEARVGAQLVHRNIVRVFDLAEEPDGLLALVMEKLRGEPLDACLARGPLEPQAAIAIALGVLAALQHAHERGVIHRDIKPGNIFLAIDADGHVEPKLLDFGIAKPRDSSIHTIDGHALGTPEYMSPEQIRDERELDGRSDLFSLAVVLYEALTGEHPFRRSTAAARISAVLETTVDPHPRIPPALWPSLARALSKRTYERPRDAAEFAAELDVLCIDGEAQQAALRGAVRASESGAEPLRLSAAPAEVVLAPVVDASANRSPLAGVVLVASMIGVGVAGWWLGHANVERHPAPAAATSASSAVVAEPASATATASGARDATSATPAAPSSPTAVASVSKAPARPRASAAAPTTASSVARPAASVRPVATTPGF